MLAVSFLVIPLGTWIAQSNLHLPDVAAVLQNSDMIVEVEINPPEPPNATCAYASSCLFSDVDPSSVIWFVELEALKRSRQ